MSPLRREEVVNEVLYDIHVASRPRSVDLKMQRAWAVDVVTCLGSSKKQA